MRWLAPAGFAVAALLGCASEPLDTPEAGEAPAVTGAPARATPGPNDGHFVPLALYPAGPYGSVVGAVIANHTFIGWRDPVALGYDTSRLEEVSLADFYDPNGEATELIVVNASAVWCPVCRLEMATIDSRDLAAVYRGSKVAIVGTLFEDAAGKPAKPADLELWGSKLNFKVEFPLVLDPGLSLGPYFSDSATPLNLLIDARTMEILAVYMGYGDTLWTTVDRELRARGVTPPAR